MIGTVRSGEQCGKMIGAVRSGELGELSPPLLQEQNESEFEVCSLSSIGRENRWSGRSKVGFREEGKERNGCLGMDIWASSRVLKMCPT